MFVIVVCFKMAPQRDNRVKVSALLRVGHKASEIVNLVGLAQPSTQSRNAWTMAKESTDVQRVLKRLLWNVTACLMSFEAVSRITFRKLSRYGFRGGIDKVE